MYTAVLAAIFPIEPPGFSFKNGDALTFPVPWRRPFWVAAIRLSCIPRRISAGRGGAILPSAVTLSLFLSEHGSPGAANPVDQILVYHGREKYAVKRPFPRYGGRHHYQPQTWGRLDCSRATAVHGYSSQVQQIGGSDRHYYHFAICWADGAFMVAVSRDDQSGELGVNAGAALCFPAGVVVAADGQQLRCISGAG